MAFCTAFVVTLFLCYFFYVYPSYSTKKQTKKPPLKIAILFVLFLRYTLAAEEGGLFLMNFAVSLNTKVLVCKEERELEH